MRTLSLLFAMCVNIVAGGPLTTNYSVNSYLENPAIKNFREYLQIDTSKEENIQTAVDFWQRLAVELSLEFTVYWPAGKPICVLTWRGEDPALPSIMLNSHMDVVGVEINDWKYPPFSAHLDDYGDIYGRGAQDTKDVAIQYIEAIRQLKAENITLRRTLHVTLMPDEETGGHMGMMPFVNTPEFKQLNIGFALDEGIASKDDTLYVTYVDKRPWQMNFTVYGTAGHGSVMPENSAMEKLQKLVTAISTYRKKQKMIGIHEDFRYNGSFNNLNINMINGGFAPNVVPSKMSLVVDMRLSVSANTSDIQGLVNSWAAAAGNDTEMQFIRRFEESQATAVDDCNPYWMAMKDAASQMNITIVPSVCPATSDMIYLRNQGISALGFSTKTHTTPRIHGSNEYHNAATFLKGIDIYVGILKKIGNL